MIRKERVALVGMALLAAVAAAPAGALAKEVVKAERHIAPVMTSDQQARQQTLNQAAADCASSGGWFDSAAGVCDVNGVK